MGKLKAILWKLLFPHMAILILLVPIAAALLIYAFAFENAHPGVVYASYFLSAYALTIVCVRTPAIITWVKNFKRDNRYLSRYFSDPQLRVKISLYTSLAMNTAYAILQLGLGFRHASIWFYSLAIYYVLLAVIFSFVLFNADSLAMAVGDFAGLLGFGGAPLVTSVSVYYLRSYAVLFITGIVGSTPIVKQAGSRIADTKAGAALESVFLAVLLLVCTAYLVDGSFSPFLYFRF